MSRGTPPPPATNPLWAPRADEDDPRRADGTPIPAGARCASCVWRHLGGRGTPVDRCRRHGNEPIDPRAPACPAYATDAEVDCLTCGACCREAYHSVEVGARDPFVRAHPDRVSAQDGRLVVTRSGSRCGCLAGEGGAFHCVVYADRPKTCRDFARAGPNCVEARRRVGLGR